MFKIEPGNPIVIKCMNDQDDTICEAMETIFPIDTDGAILWLRGTKHYLSYKYDIGIMMNDILFMIDNLLSHESGAISITWPTNTFCFTWDIEWTQKMVSVYTSPNLAIEDGNNNHDRHTLIVNLSAYIMEWAQILKITINGLTDAGYNKDNLSDLGSMENVLITVKAFENGNG